MISTSIESDGEAASYDPGAKSFHWVTVALLGSQFILGWIMPGMRNVTQPAGLISLHFSLGIVILGITAARILWRFRRRHACPRCEPAAMAASSRADLAHGPLWIAVCADLQRLGLRLKSWHRCDVFWPRGSTGHLCQGIGDRTSDRQPAFTPHLDPARRP